MKSVIHRSIKYRIYPNEQQAELLTQTFGCVRKVYNMALELQEGLYKAGMECMSNFDLNNYCNRVWKNEFEYLRQVDKFALSNAIFAAGAAYRNFFAGRASHPKYKRKHTDSSSYTTNESHQNIAIHPAPYRKSHKGSLKLPKLGLVDATIHRCPEACWKIKGATVSLSSSGMYYASLLFEYTIDLPHINPSAERSLGLDYSSPHFYIDSNGHSADMPHLYRELEKRIQREERRLSRMVRGSSNYRKQVKLIASLHEHIANKRKDFCHQLSRKIANSYDVVCVEDINLRNLSQCLNLGKSTHDNGFGMFRRFLKYKLEEQGKYYVVISRWFPSTKRCHGCGTVNPAITLRDRTWVCPACGKELLRDYNAAKNTLDFGFQTLLSSIQAEA